MNIEIVNWMDSSSKFGWVDKPDCRCDILVCQSVGYVIDETVNGVAIAQSRSAVDGYKPFADIVSIPKVAILSRKVIMEVADVEL